jgi:hypothetical protein
VKSKSIDDAKSGVGKLHEADGKRTRWSTRTQVIVSALVVLHMLAVVAEPFHFFTRSRVRPSAADARLLRQTLAPYVDFMYLSHGYFFFAPNPGPNHIIRCELTPIPGTNAKSTSQPVVIEYPDRKDQWPRLLYHRHFMMSEFYNNMFVPPEAPIEARQSPETIAQWQGERDRYVMIQKSIRKNLKRKYPNHEVQLRRIEHYQPSEYQYFNERWKLTDPRLYVELPESFPTEAAINGAGSNQANPDPAAPNNASLNGSPASGPVSDLPIPLNVPNK